MGAVVVVLLCVAILVALCVSIVQFWRGRDLGAETIRELAALSSLVTLVIVVLLFSGLFLHEALAALREVGASAGLREAAGDALRHVDEACINVINAINGVIGGPDVGYRPEPPVWPAVLLGIAYSVRFLIYRFHTRRHNTDAALTGAAYWSFISTFVMLLAYLIVLADFDPVPLIPASLIALAIVVIGVRVFFEDFGLALRVAVKTISTEVSRAASFIAYLATEIAGAVRELLAYANRLYIERIRKPLRRFFDAAENRNKRSREGAQARLARQNAAHTERFRRPPSSRDDSTD
jgi:hypothetical protein